MSNNSIDDNGGYGVNIAASTCDNNDIVGNEFNNNTSGAISDNGTATIIAGNSPNSLNASTYNPGGTDVTVPDGGTGSSSFTDAGVILGNGAGALQVTTAGTAGQVLTSNGAGVDPSFKAVSSAVAIVPMPASGGIALSTNQFTSATAAYFSAFVLPASITVNKLSFSISAVVSAQTFDVAVYSEDGQTKHIDITTASIAGTGDVTTAVGSVALSAGVYYIGVVPNGTVDVTFNSWDTIHLNVVAVTSEPVLQGTKTVTSGTLPATINPVADITEQANAILFRLDN